MVSHLVHISSTLVKLGIDDLHQLLGSLKSLLLSLACVFWLLLDNILLNFRPTKVTIVSS